MPKDEIDSVVYRSIYALGIAGVSTIASCLLCFAFVRAYARRATTLALEDSLREKETLLREVHHRVKNNMQATMGILLFERRRTKIAQAFPNLGSKMLFLFDYGDQWQFKVEVIGLGEKVPKARYPRVIKSMGTAPPQYPDPDEAFEDE